MRRDVETARRLGVSVRRLFGWEPVRSTTWTYDRKGRVVRSETVTEPEWDDEQRGLMLALAEYESGLCDGCGHPLSDTTGLDQDEQWVAEPVGRCHACDALAIAVERRQHTPRKHLLRWRTRRRDGR